MFPASQGAIQLILFRKMAALYKQLCTTRIYIKCSVATSIGLSNYDSHGLKVRQVLSCRWKVNNFNLYSVLKLCHIHQVNLTNKFTLTQTMIFFPKCFFSKPLKTKVRSTWCLDSPTITCVLVAINLFSCSGIIWSNKYDIYTIWFYCIIALLISSIILFHTLWHKNGRIVFVYSQRHLNCLE